MRRKMSGFALVAALLPGLTLLASPLAAQTYTYPDPTKKPPAVNSRTKARVTVEKRSFLDAGTEVLPGQRKFTDYAFPPGYSPTAPIDFTAANIRGPLIGPWDTSRNNFYPW